MKQLRKLLAFTAALALSLNMLTVEAYSIGTRETQTTGTDISASEHMLSADKIKLDEDISVILGEDETKRTEYSKTFIKSNGTYSVAEYRSAVHYKDAEDKWQNIDNTLALVESADKNSASVYKNKAGAAEITFSENTGADKLISIENNDYTFSWGIESNAKSAVDAEIVKSGDTSNSEADDADKYTALSDITSGIEYKKVLNNVDLRYILNGSDVKEYIIINSKDDEYKYSFNITTDLNLILNADGSISGFNQNDEKKIKLPAPYIFDAKNRYSDAVSYELVKNEESNEYILTVCADEEWVNSDETEFPVTIDPTVVTSVTPSLVDSTFVASKTPTTSYGNYGTLNVGNCNEYYNCRSLVKFTLPTLQKSDVIVDAQMNLYQYSYSFNPSSLTQKTFHAHMATSNWSETTTWNTKPTYNSTILEYGFIDSNNGWKSLDITKAVRKWYAGSASNYGIVLKGDTEPANGQSGYSRFVTEEHPNYPTQVRPFIYITYRNNKGLESYWTYHSYSAGDYGTAYVNDYSGNIVYINSTSYTNGGKMPVAVNLVYNGYQAGRNFRVANTQTTSLFANSNYGYGWKLSIQETITPVLDASISGNGYKYIYTDGDGTEHYFYETSSGATTYKDEDGLGLSLKKNTSNFVLSDDKGNKKTFNQTGYIISVSDANSNTVSYAYSGSGVNSRITKITDASSRAITLTYNSSNYLTQIKDNSNRITTITYSGNKVQKITYPDGTFTTFTYFSGVALADIVDSASSYKLNIGYDSALNRVVQIRGIATSGGDTLGQTVKIAYSAEDASTTFRTSGKDDIINNTDDLQTTYIFDDWGRTVSEYSTNVVDAENASNSELYGACMYEYEQNTSGGKSNKIKSTAANGKQSTNMLVNHNFEYNSNWTSGTWGSGGTYTNTSDSSNAYLGAKSRKINVTAATSASKVGAYQNVTLSSTGTYTYSAYVKTSATSSTGGAYIDVLNSAGTSVGTSRIVSGTTSAAIDNGWQRISVTFTISATGTYKFIIGRKASAGTAYFDCVQLEKGKYLTGYNLLENGSFSSGITGWGARVGEGTTAFTPSTSSGEASYTGESANKKYLYQYVKAGGNVKTNSFILSGWGKADSVPCGTTRLFGLQAVVEYSDGTVKSCYTPFLDNTAGWQFASMTIVPDSTKTITQITVRCKYDFNCNTVRFDNISLVPEIAQTYTYNADGKVVSTVSAANQASTFTYSGSKDLIQVVNPSGYNYNYSYDNKHQVTNATSERGTQYAFTYDAYGNVIGSRTIASAASNTNAELSSQFTYINNGDFLSSTKDCNNATTGYTYNAAKGLLSSMTNPNGTVTTYAYNSSNDLSTSVTSGGTSISYTYSGRRLSSIAHNSFSYNFLYDVFGNIINTKVGTQSLISNTYASNNGKLIGSDYGNGQGFTYVYDELDRVIQKNYNGGSVEYQWEYDGNGNVSKHKDNLSGKTYLYEYDSLGRIVRGYELDSSNQVQFANQVTYDNINRVSGKSYQYGNETAQNYSYSYLLDNILQNTTLPSNAVMQYCPDGLGRTYKQTFTASGATTPFLQTNYEYKAGNTANVGAGKTATSTRISKTTSSLGSNYKFEYTYDNNGNITQIKRNGTLVYSYQYDSLDRLIRENNSDANKTYVYTYDNGGNILNKKTYAYTTGTLSGTPTTKNYVYGNSNWRDLLTSYDGTAISYDAIGNPTSYRSASMTWQKGRQLASYAKGGTTTTYTYNSDGIRTSKKVGSTTTDFTLDGTKIIRSQKGTVVLYFYYDESGSPIGMKLNGTNHYFVKNIQGDVIALVNESGTVTATYKYDAWGNLLSYTGGGAALANPFRYRSYYYDIETGFYYLNSRYYDPVVGRFINADDTDVLTVEQGSLLQYNLFAYCLNNPVNRTDDSGYLSIPNWLKVTIGVGVIAGLAVATVVTGGAAGVIAGAALTGALSGAASGAAIGAVTGGINGGWQGALNGACDGFMSGAIIGGATGALSAGANIATGATRIVGSAQKTGTLFHRAASNLQAGKMAMQVGRYSKIGLDVSLKKVGLVGRKMPDVIGVARFGTNKLVEVVSKSQTTAQMMGKCVNMVGMNPGARYGVVSWAANISRLF